MYSLALTTEDVNTINFVGVRYGWSDSLLGYDIGEHELTESEAWAIRDAIESDMEGGHDAFPMLDSESDLATKLADLCEQIV